jgi:hypothetical protein
LIPIPRFIRRRQQKREAQKKVDACDAKLLRTSQEAIEYTSKSYTRYCREQLRKAISQVRRLRREVESTALAIVGGSDLFERLALQERSAMQLSTRVESLIESDDHWRGCCGALDQQYAELRRHLAQITRGSSGQQVRHYFDDFVSARKTVTSTKDEYLLKQSLVTMDRSTRAAATVKAQLEASRKQLQEAQAKMCNFDQLRATVNLEVQERVDRVIATLTASTHAFDNGNLDRALAQIARFEQEFKKITEDASKSVSHTKAEIELWAASDAGKKFLPEELSAAVAALSKSAFTGQDMQWWTQVRIAIEEVVNTRAEETRNLNGKNCPIRNSSLRLQWTDHRLDPLKSFSEGVGRRLEKLEAEVQSRVNETSTSGVSTSCKSPGS